MEHSSFRNRWSPSSALMDILEGYGRGKILLIPGKSTPLIEDMEERKALLFELDEKP